MGGVGPEMRINYRDLFVRYVSLLWDEFEDEDFDQVEKCRGMVTGREMEAIRWVIAEAKVIRETKERVDREERALRWDEDRRSRLMNKEEAEIARRISSASSVTTPSGNTVTRENRLNRFG